MTTTTFQTRPGAHGTLYRYRILYRSDDSGSPTNTWGCWAYSAEHALDMFYDDDSEGWIVVGEPTRVRVR